MKIGERYEYVGKHSPWHGYQGTVTAIVRPPLYQYDLAQFEFDRAPGVENSVYITPYNSKQWRLIDEAAVRKDRDPIARTG